MDDVGPKNHRQSEKCKKSTGPRSKIGQRKSRRNALRHGLAIAPGADRTLSADIETMAKAIASADDQKPVGELARQLAEVEIDLSRIRKIRASLFNTLYEKTDVQLQDHIELSNNLAKLERYERRAFSRRKRAISQGA